ncbi:MAG: ATP-binding protein [Desulfovibrionaceae bacterium]
MLAQLDSAEPEDAPGADGLDAAIALLEALPDRAALLCTVIGLLRRWTGCEAVGVRLRQGEDYPYFTTLGFPEHFVMAENRLCAVDRTGEPVRDPAGRVVLECVCGAVLDGRLDPSMPFCTAKGSFFTGSTTALLAAVRPEGLRVGRTRNRCHGAGYETVVLTPLRTGGTTFGLMQLGDHRIDAVSRPTLERLERLADGVAMVLAHQEREQALLAAEARYRAVFATNVAVKLLIDPDSGYIMDANPAACSFYGYAPEVLSRLSIFDINTMEPDQLRREMELALGGERRTFRFSHRVADGSVRDVEVYTGPVAFSGRTLLFSIIHDVTDRVHAEQARDRAEQILRHDLRSPLTGIAGLAGHLTEKETDPVSRDALVAIREAAQRLLGLVGRNLDFCRIEQGNYVLSPRPVPLGELLQELVRESAVLARTRQVDLSLGGVGRNSGAPGGPIVAGEPDLLGALFANLITNALEAAPRQSAVTVSVTEAGAAACVTVHNLGVIPEAIRPQFFKKYATCGKDRGTGLGAYTARKIARLHGGDIDWSSGENSGTRLTVRLPRYQG